MSQLVVCFIDQSILFDDVDIRENCLRMACVELQDWRLLIITPSAPCLPALYQGTQWNGSNQFLRLHSLSPCPFEPPRRGRRGLDQPRPHANSRYPSQRRRLGNYGNDASSPTSLTGDVTSEIVEDETRLGLDQSFNKFIRLVIVTFQQMSFSSHKLEINAFTKFS